MKHLVLLLCSALLSGCWSVRTIHKDRPDIKRISLTPGMAFDIRDFVKEYGKPQFIDSTANVLIYWNTYELFDTINIGKDKWVEDWYLVLFPAEERHFFTAKRYEYKYDIDEDVIYQKDDITISTYNYKSRKWKTYTEIRRYCTKNTTALQPGFLAPKMYHKDLPNIREISYFPGLVFDIRILEKKYGKRHITDQKENAIIYYNTYDLGSLSDNTRMADWYLILTPTEEKYYYSGQRYKYEYIRKNKPNSLNDVQISLLGDGNPNWRSVAEIKENCTPKSY